MNTDVRIKTNYPDHPKIRKLKKLLGPSGPLCHIFLLCFIARVTPSGVLKDMDAEDIASVARWTGEPAQFVDTLVELKLLDKQDDTYAIHNWQKHNFFAMTAPIRSEVARRNINKRWAKKNKVKQAVNTDGITDSNTPSPSPSKRGSGKDPPLEAAGLSPPANIKELIELGTDMCKGNFIDTTKEREFYRLLEQATEEMRTEFDKYAALAGFEIRGNPYAE